MPFKILCTLEKGKYKHWIAPSTWEHNNVVQWPKINASKLDKVENSLPGPDWPQMKCQVKRNNILTYEDAERELAKMMDNTDTDEEINYTRHPNNIQQELNFNAMIEQVVTSQENPIKNTAPVEITDQTEIIYCAVNNDQENIDLKNISESVNILIRNQNIMMEALLDNQTKMMHKLASLSIQVDKINLQLCNLKETEVTPLQQTRNQSENMPFSFDKITNIDELNTLEMSLSDKITREHLKKTLSIVCDAGNGTDCAYTLVDIIFSRDFLCQCSWSGSSRDDGIKISLKCKKNVISFFWEMIFHWDPTYTITKNEIFFKSVLKNANKRKLAKRVRASTSRKRSNVTNKEINANINMYVDNTEKQVESHTQNQLKSNNDNDAIENDTVEDSLC